MTMVFNAIRAYEVFGPLNCQIKLRSIPVRRTGSRSPESGILLFLGELMSKFVGTSIAAVFLATGSLGIARADIALLSGNNFTGLSCPTCNPADQTYQKSTSSPSGTFRFDSSSNNPLPNILGAIDPNFYTHFQVDSLTVSVMTRWGTGWYLEVGNGTTTGWQRFALTSNNGPGVAKLDSFTIYSDNPMFATFLDGSFIGRFKRDVGSSSLEAYNAKAWVTYSEKPISAVPDMGSSLLLLGLSGLGLLGLAAFTRISATENSRDGCTWQPAGPVAENTSWRGTGGGLL